MELIDKSTLVAEIEKLKSVFVNERDGFEKGYHYSLNLLISFLDTLEVKVMDLEKEFDEYTKHITAQDVKDEPFTQLFACAKHFFELGLQSKEE